MVIFRNGKIVGVDKEFLKRLNERLNTLSYLLNIVELQIADLKREVVELKGEKFKVKRVDLLTLEGFEIFQFEPVGVSKTAPSTPSATTSTSPIGVAETAIPEKSPVTAKQERKVIPIVKIPRGLFAVKIDGKIVSPARPAEAVEESSQTPASPVVAGLVGETETTGKPAVDTSKLTEPVLKEIEEGLEQLFPVEEKSPAPEREESLPTPEETVPMPEELELPPVEPTSEEPKLEEPTLKKESEKGVEKEEEKGTEPLPSLDDLDKLIEEVAPPTPEPTPGEEEVEEKGAEEADDLLKQLDELELPPVEPTSEPETEDKSEPKSEEKEEGELENLDDLLGDLEVTPPTPEPEKEEKPATPESELEDLDLDQLLGEESGATKKEEEKGAEEADLGELEDLDISLEEPAPAEPAPKGEGEKEEKTEELEGLDDLDALLEEPTPTPEAAKKEKTPQPELEELDLGELEGVEGEKVEEEKKEEEREAGEEPELDLELPEESQPEEAKEEPPAEEKEEKEEPKSTEEPKREEPAKVEQKEETAQKPSGPIILQFDDDFEEVRQLLQENPEVAKKKIFEELAKASEELGIPPDLGEELFKELLNQIKAEKGTFEEVIAKKDYENLHRTAHKLKGAALNLRLSQLALILKMIDEYSKRREPIEVIADLVRSFYSFMDKLEGIESSFGEGNTATGSSTQPETAPKKEEPKESEPAQPEEPVKPKLTRIVLKTIRKYLEKGDEKAFQRDKKHIEKLLKTKLNSLEDLKKFIGE